MQVGTTRDQGLYNKPSAAVDPGALAAGTLPQYSTIGMSECYGIMKARCYGGTDCLHIQDLLTLGDEGNNSLRNDDVQLSRHASSCTQTNGIV